MLSDDILEQAKEIVALYRVKARKLTTAESCTGGLVSAAITYVGGASDVFERSFVTYSNEAKIEMLGIAPALLREHGAVSEENARAMAEAARRIARADVGLSVTGIAGPGGGTEKKPVGLVYIGLATQQGSAVRKFNFKGDRKDIRQDTVREALAWLYETGKRF
jgi:nicotinamide-nucleotide amidase